MSESLVDVIVSLDTGVTLSKAFWMAWPDGKPKMLVMAPELIEVKQSDILDFGLAGGSPAANAVVILKNGRCLAFGEKARDMRGKPPVVRSKYEPAVYKALAVVGSIAQLLELESNFRLGLSAVLPYSEYQDNERFQELLKEHLADFTFLGQHYCVALDLLDVKPEGAGLGLIRREDDKLAFANSNVTVVMLGQRDASLLPFKKGFPQVGTSVRLGFNQFLDAVKMRAALNLEPADEALLPELVFRGQSEAKCIERIARMAVSPFELESKVAQILEAIAACQEKYWTELSDWLSSALGQSFYQLNEVVVSGGAALYFRPQIEKFFSDEKIAISWAAGLDSHISSLLRHEVDAALSFRLADAFGLFKLLGGKAKRMESSFGMASNGGSK